MINKKNINYKNNLAVLTAYSVSLKRRNFSASDNGNEFMNLIERLWTNFKFSDENLKLSKEEYEFLLGLFENSIKNFKDVRRNSKVTKLSQICERKILILSKPSQIKFHDFAVYKAVKTRSEFHKFKMFCLVLSREILDFYENIQSEIVDLGDPEILGFFNDSSSYFFDLDPFDFSRWKELTKFKK